MEHDREKSRGETVGETNANPPQKRKRKYPSLLAPESREFFFMDTDPDEDRYLMDDSEGDAPYIPRMKMSHAMSRKKGRAEELKNRNARKAHEYEEEAGIKEEDSLYSGTPSTVGLRMDSMRLSIPAITARTHRRIIYKLCENCGTEIYRKHTEFCPKCGMPTGLPPKEENATPNWWE